MQTAPSLTAEINQGKLRPYRPAGSYESVSRRVDGAFLIYARYLGGP
jgi:hypothetical protein